MEIKIENQKNVLKISLLGELDHHSAKEVREKADSIIDQGSIKHLVFDFSDVGFMDSAGIGVIIGRYNKIKDIGGRVIIINCSATVNRLLTMGGIFTLIMQADNMAEALKLLGQEAGDGVR